MTSAVTDNGAVVHVVATPTLATMELLTVVLPRQGVAGAAILTETVGTLALVGDKKVIVTAGADDDTVAGPKGTALLVLAIGAEENILSSPIVVTGGLQMTDTLLLTGFDLTELAWVADNRRQMTGLRVQLRIEKKITLVLAVDGILAVT